MRSVNCVKRLARMYYRVAAPLCRTPSSAVAAGRLNLYPRVWASSSSSVSSSAAAAAQDSAGSKGKGGHLDSPELTSTVNEVIKENEVDLEWARNAKGRLRSGGGAGAGEPLWTPTAPLTAPLVNCKDMRDYVQQRGFSGVQSDASSLRTLSSLLAFPLTLALGVRNIFGGHRRSLKVVVVGARSESNLPMTWWREALCACDVDSIELIMTGPGLKPTSRQEAEVAFTGGGGGGGGKARIVKHVSAADGHVLHEHPNRMRLLMEADLFVLFNPGLGSAALRHSWEPSVELLLDTRKPVLCSAHGPHDLKRDVSAVTNIALRNDTQELGDPLDLLLPPMPNPFASLKRAVDATEEPGARIVLTNHSVYAFQSK